MKQAELVFRSWGGKRKGAGRPPLDPRQRRPVHLRRPEHQKAHPLHVTMRAVRDVPSFRVELYFRGIRRIFARASKSGFRLLQFSVQGNHIHLIVEADDKRALGRGMQWLASTIARSVNFSRGRRGSVWRERYHREDLTTPSKVRNALVYVLMNHRKHQPRDVFGAGPCLDDRSSAFWFDGWDPRAKELAAHLRPDEDVAPVVPARTWLAREGWRRRGLLRIGAASPRAVTDPRMRHS
jgi:putative transposase